MDNNNCEIKFEKITTGNGFQNDLIATANNRVELAVVEICKLKDTISKFEKTIVDLDDKNERLQKKVLWLTVITVIFTATQIIQAIDILIKWFK
jgi:predicted  nucleic acid-binding Zn-ribbon protein